MRTSQSTPGEFRTTAARRQAGSALMILVQWSLLASAAAAQFEDRTASAGLTNGTAACVSAAWGDYDNDGDIDLYLASDGRTEANTLYQNNGDATFIPKTPLQCGPIASDAAGSTACAWVDFNNDGYRDMLVTHRAGPVRLYSNYGQGLFAPAVAQTWMSSAAVIRGPACADYDGNGLIDIFMVQAAADAGPFRARLFRATPPESFAGYDLGPAGSEATSAVWGDYNNDGKPDLFVCNVAASALWRNDGNGQFTRLNNSLSITDAVGHAAWADYDNDGDLDIVLGAASGTHLYRNAGEGGFVLATSFSELGTNAIPTWVDYDNDGRLDLFIVSAEANSRETRLYRGHPDGSFNLASEPMTATADFWLSCAWGDYDNDGAMDVLLTHASGQSRLYRNSGNANHWLKVRLTGVAANRDAIGTKVRIKATIAGQTVWQIREVSGGSLQQDDTRLNFGLGDATEIDLVRIEWPSGNVFETTGVGLDRTVNFKELVNITPTNPSISSNGPMTLTSRNYGPAAQYQWCFEDAYLWSENDRTLGAHALSRNGPGHYSVLVITPDQTLTNHVYLTADATFTRVVDDPLTSEATGVEGCSWGDLDGDGKIDLFMTASGGGARDRMYRNQGDGTFASVDNEVTNASVARSIGSAWADFDNNGTLDLMVGQGGGSLDTLYANDGAGHFTVLPAAQFPAETLTTRSLAWADYDRDGNVDLFIVNQGLNPSLYHNEGNGTFSRITTGVPATESLLAVAPSWCDYDLDGYPDLFVGTYKSPTGGRLYHNNGDGTFTRITEGPVVTIAATAWGSSWGDYDNDGYPDLFVARTFNTPNSLFHNNGDGTFSEIKTGFVTTAATFSFAGIWGDYDNDGYLDLFVSNFGPDSGAGERNFLFHNDRQGGFTRIWTGSLANEVAPFSGCAWGDYNDDGFLDLAVMIGGPFHPALYRNNGNSNHWLKLKLIGTASNRAAIGAKVRVEATIWNKAVQQVREVSGGDGYASQNDLRPHFGLGDAVKADTVRIEWPSGAVQILTNVTANQLLTVTESVAPRLRATRAGNACGLTIACQPGCAYRIEASTDLREWQQLTTFTSTAASYEHTDDEAVARPFRFYRVVPR